ncbi:MAG: DNA topoisomerase, partial [Defluviitaleaceae bacterium]|nr:DNA topoisomerase [Defluviitaleaceae bacterium]
DGVLKMLCAGDSVTARAAQALKKQTQPPKPYTEASLLSAMENAGRFIEDEALREKLKDSGLGTPATRAATIERLIEVGYVTRRQKCLDATEKGVRIIDMVPVELKSPETTGKWERALSRIAKGEAGEARFMESIVNYVKYIVGYATNPETRGCQ